MVSDFEFSHMCYELPASDLALFPLRLGHQRLGVGVAEEHLVALLGLAEPSPSGAEVKLALRPHRRTISMAPVLVDKTSGRCPAGLAEQIVTLKID